MLISLIGPRASGKTSVESYLVNLHGFKIMSLSMDGTRGHEDARDAGDSESWKEDSDKDSDIIPNAGLGVGHRDSFLSMDVSSPLTPMPVRQYPATNTSSVAKETTPLVFYTADELLDFATRNWRDRLVTSDLCRKDVLDEFAIRPFFLLIYVDAPITIRYGRHKRLHENHAGTLEEFITEDDAHIYGHSELHEWSETGNSSSSSLVTLEAMVNLRILNHFSSLEHLHSHLNSLHLVDQDRLRPAWDTYFMRLASLASLRSNCMKRRVGAILVKDKRIVATGYNGTARGLRNCNEGGCLRCNGYAPSGHALDECVCLHAEENALLEAGRERIGEGVVLYCNTCPCLRCTVKIIQTGVKEVIYNLSYRVDDASAALFKEAGIPLRRHALPT